MRSRQNTNPALCQRPNKQLQRTACKLRLKVPSALRAPAADHLRRSALP